MCDFCRIEDIFSERSRLYSARVLTVWCPRIPTRPQRNVACWSFAVSAFQHQGTGRSKAPASVRCSLRRHVWCQGPIGEHTDAFPPRHSSRIDYSICRPQMLFPFPQLLLRLLFFPSAFLTFIGADTVLLNVRPSHRVHGFLTVSLRCLVCT